MGDVELTPLDLLQQLAQIVVVEGQRPHQEGVQYHAAGPDVRAPAVVLFTLKYTDANLEKTDINH